MNITSPDRSKCSTLCLIPYLCVQFLVLIKDLIISYPWWFLLLVVLAGLAYASLLYLRNRKMKGSRGLRTTLFILRFLSTALIAFLLLSPLIKSRTRILEKPLILFAVDNSRSILLSEDSAFYRTAFPKALDELENSLKEKYDVESYLFGEQTRSGREASYQDTYSDYANLFAYLPTEYSGRNVGALIIIGDGISNRGIDPEFAMTDLTWPVYSIAMGDTNLRKDIQVKDVRYNSLVYRDDDFPLEVTISANGMAGTSSVLEVYAFGEKAASVPFTITSKYYSRQFTINLPARESGKQRIVVAVREGEDEVTTRNNRRNVFIDVLDNRQKILILGNGPHPDMGTVKSCLETSRNFEVNIETYRLFKGNVESYDLVILHEVPSMRIDAQMLLNDLKTKKIPILFILGKQSQISRFSAFFPGLELRTTPGNFEQAQFLFNPSFSRFSISREEASVIESLPPLIVPFGTYRVAATADVLGYQSINRIPTDFPLILFDESGEQRMGLIAGEGLWLWRLQSNQQYGNSNALNTLLSKSAQYLMARKDRRHFRVLSEGEYSSNQRVTLRAELFNAAYEPVNEPDVNLSLTNEKGEQFNFLFAPDGDTYSLDLDRLPEGIYKYSGSTTLGKERYTSGGEFVVSERSIESRDLKADHAFLYRIAEKQGGTMLFPGEMGELTNLLGSRSDIRDKVYYEEKYLGLQHVFYILLVILLLLSAEWFLRKYYLGY